MQRFGINIEEEPLLYYYSINLSRKRLVLVRSEVLGQFANTSTVHYKYSR